jgi:outer membrane lipoprotein SlyB
MHPADLPPGAPVTRARPHPILIAAAIAVILFCLVATAAVMGWIPSTLGGNGAGKSLTEADRLALSSKMQQQDAAGAVITPQPYADVAPAPVAKPIVTPAPAAQNFVPEAPPRPVAEIVPAKPAAPERDWCKNCGNIESIRTITTRAEGSGLGAGTGAVLGGLLGNQVGGGHGRQLATVAGAIGGAVVGNQVEGRVKASTSYEISVRLDNGKYRTFHQASEPGWREGDRVRIVNGGLRSVG